MSPAFSMRRFLPALAALFLVGVAAAAPVTGGSDNKSKLTTAEQFRKALDQNITLELADQSVEELAAKLKAATKINFVAGKGAGSAAWLAQIPGVESPGGITLKLENGKLRQGLRVLLAEHGLACAVVGDRVLITDEEEAVQIQVHQRVSIDLNDATLAGALKQLARETGTNIVLDQRLAKEGQTPVTLTLDEVPLDVAVRLMAESAGLKSAVLGNVIFVTNKASASDLQRDQELRKPRSDQEKGGRADYGMPNFLPGGGFGRPKALPVPAPAIEPVPPKPPAKEKD